MSRFNPVVLMVTGYVGFAVNAIFALVVPVTVIVLAEFLDNHLRFVPEIVYCVFGSKSTV